ncbi:MAG: DUF4469 domain-containing protein [Treponema sp.]|nr:DUF4469 domain-containing protein [Treponema sp.]
MSLINNVNEKLHRIRVRLYPNYLPSVAGSYIARTNNEASLSIEDVCAALKNRGGFTGKYENLVENVRQFFDEAAYQLCDGFAVNTGYYSIQPNISGTFNSEKDAYNGKKNPLDFRFRALSALRNLAQHINIDIEGVANVSGWIDEFTDTDVKTVNSTFSEGNIFSIAGCKIKIAGDDPSCGVFFVPEEDASKAVKVTRIAENSGSRIIGVCKSTGFQKNKIEIRTQFSAGSRFLKVPRIITSDFVLEEM